MKKNYLFLGFAIPDEEMDKIIKADKFPAIQTHKFNWNIIKGIEFSDEIDCTYISASPISDYPYFPIKKIKQKRWSVCLPKKTIEITEIPFINTSIFKIVSRFFSTLYLSIKQYHKQKNKGGVIVYSVHVPFMMVGYIMSKIYQIDYIAIWTDPPSVIGAREGFIKSKLRGIEFILSKFLMKKANKIIALTKYLAEDFAPNKPYIVIEGIIDEEDTVDIGLKSKKDTKCIKIVYTGSIEQRYGIKNIVDGVLLLEKNKNVILEIYGKGDFEEELKEICLKDKRIIYKGFVSNKEILKIQREADFLINARSQDEEFVKYSFPSKTLEYMLSGTPLITTMLPGIPEEYEDYVIVLKNNKAETIRNEIENLLSMMPEDKNNIGTKAKKFIMKKSYKYQGEKIARFITS